MTPCQRKPDDLFEFTDGELEFSRKRQVEQHIEKCCNCARFLRRFRLQKSLLKRLTLLKTRDTFFILLQERIRREMAGKRTRPAWSLIEIQRWIPATAFALVAIVAASLILTRKNKLPALTSKAALKAQSSAVVSKKESRHVQYVIDEFPRSQKINPAKSDSNRYQMASADTSTSVKHFDGLKGRLVPVSF
jgi:anti-sigma factor RsiW